MTWTIAAQGFGISSSLLVVIGAQNAFVLRQGLQRSYPLLTAAVCSLCDAILITIGAAGFGTLVATQRWLLNAVTIIGVAFLVWYAVRSFRAAFQNHAMDLTRMVHADNPKAVVGKALGFTLLNPHVYLDTIVLIGGIAAQYTSHERVTFTAGAICASIVWFFSLSFGARLLTPLFKKPSAWKALDIFIGCVLAITAVSLIRQVL